MKMNLSDITFLISIRVDSIVRLENLIATTKFLLKNFVCRVIVLESASYNNGVIKKLLSSKIEYYFIEDHDTVFYHTKYTNIMAEKVTTTFLCIWDVDVIVPVTQIVEAVEKLRSRKYEAAFPYDGRALDTSADIRELFVRSCNINILKRQQLKMCPLHQDLKLRGGAVFVSTDAYRRAGMDNLSFYGWGSEDFERFDRWRILGYTIYIVPGVLYHLTHPREKNSRFNNGKQLIQSAETIFKTRVSSAEELANN